LSVLQVKAAVAVAIVLMAMGALYGAYCHGQTVADDRWKAQWADQQALQAKGLAAATTANRTEERRRQAAVNQVANDARQQQVEAVADAAAADAAGQRVRDQAGKLAAGASCTPGDSGATQRSQAATRAAMVLSDLFQRADERAGELAKAYDAARVAGMACEVAFDKVRYSKP
jgi:hypothetical protein